MDERIARWSQSYKDLADIVVAKHVALMAKEFPDEYFPVRPNYRKAMYHYLVAITDELNQKMDELLEESPDETDDELKDILMGMQEEYEKAFIAGVRKDPANPLQGE